MRYINFFAAVAVFAVAPVAEAIELTDKQIRETIIQESIDAYHASGRPCACPYDVARNGSSCGGRSAYSRPGGEAPLCYAKDVTDDMVRDRRKTLTVAAGR